MPAQEPRATEPRNPSPDSAPGTVLITGAARRLGAAMARGLAAEGWDVVLHHRRSGAEAEALAEELRGLGRRAWTLAADLARPEDCEALVPRAVELAGPLSALVNNASIFPASQLADFSAEGLADCVQLHAVAPAILARAFAGGPFPSEAGTRHVLNLLDSKITGPDDEHLAYHLSKRMLASLTRVLARQLAPRVAVNAVAPGAMLPAVGAGGADFDSLAATIPLQRTGRPADVAAAAAFLLGSTFITGQTLFVDGGRHLEGRQYD